MSRVVAGTLLLPNGQPMANASIHFTAKRTEAVSIIEGSNTFFPTNSAGAYSQSVVNGFYAVSIEYIADASGAYTRRWQLGDVFIETGAPTTLEALIIASNVPDDIALGVFYEILEQAQAAAASAAASAEAAAESADSIDTSNFATAAQGAKADSAIQTADLNARLGTTGNLGTAAQQNSTAFATAAQGTKADSAIQTADLNTRLGTAGNLGGMAQQNASAVAIAGGNVNGTSVGTTTPAAGKFTTLDVTASNAYINAPVGQASMYLSQGGVSNGRIAAVGGGGVKLAVEGVGHLELTSTIVTSFYCNGAIHGTLLPSGRWGFGTINPTTHKVEVIGRVSASDGFVFPPYLKTTVPSASANTNVGIIVTDAAGAGRRPFWSDGTNWRDAANVILA